MAPPIMHPPSTKMWQLLKEFHRDDLHESPGGRGECFRLRGHDHNVDVEPPRWILLQGGVEESEVIYSFDAYDVKEMATTSRHPALADQATLAER